MLRWPSGGMSCLQAVSLTKTGPNFGGKRRWFVCDLTGDRVRNCTGVSSLRPQDHASIVVYAGASGLVLPPTPGNREEKIVGAIGHDEHGEGKEFLERVQVARML